jgi:hypothetical protein
MAIVVYVLPSTVRKLRNVFESSSGHGHCSGTVICVALCRNWSALRVRKSKSRVYDRSSQKLQIYRYVCAGCF